MASKIPKNHLLDGDCDCYKPRQPTVAGGMPPKPDPKSMYLLEMRPKPGLKPMYFEGDGARSFSELVILKELMSELRTKKYPEKPDKVMLPCEEFSMIGGRGTGGLFAIMLARLRMSVEEVIDEFSIITEQVYKRHSPDRGRLKGCLEQMFINRRWDRDMRLEDGWQDDHCAGFALSIEPIKCFRSYPLQYSSSNTRVIDAMLDSCAPNTAFTPTHAANVPHPLLQFVLEARALYGGGALVVSLLSLGSGHFGITHISDTITIAYNDTITIANNTVLERLSNSEVSAKRMERRMKDIGGYFRFSIEHGMQKNEPSYDDGLVSVNALALSYLDDEEVRNTIAFYVETLVDVPGWISLDTLVHAIRVQATTRGPNENVAPSCDQYHIQREALPDDDEGLTVTVNNDHGRIMIKLALFIVVVSLALFHVIS